MDASSFDGLTKSLSARLTRRRSLGFLGALGLGARADLEGIDAKKKKKRKKKKPPSPCTVSSSETASTTDLTVSLKGLTLSARDSIPHAGGELTSTTIVRQKRALLLQTTASLQGDGLARIEIVYGKAYTGIGRADLTTDGETVSGTVDGRAIVPFAASAQPDTIQFQDGQPAPRMSLSPKLNRQLAQLFAKAEAQAEACKIPEEAGASGVSAERHTSDKCLKCVGACSVAAAACLKGGAAFCAAKSTLCVFAAPACFAGCMAVALVGCGVGAEVCADICARGSCCAAPCHRTNGDTYCCEEGETCLRPGTCCGAGQTPCGGQNCCAPGTCMPNGNCCPPPNFICGGFCVGPLTTCCGGAICNGVCIGNTCCPGGRDCNGSCCPNDRRCCGNGCCGPGQVCDAQNRCSNACAFMCNGQCCQTGDVCCGGIMCRHRALCPG